MTLSGLARRAAALALALALTTPVLSAEETDTLTIVGSFTAYGQYGTVGPELAGVLANGASHTWTLTMYGVTSQHQSNNATLVTATSFDLAFSGPDAATLDAVVGTHGGAVMLYMCNIPVDASAWWMTLEGAAIDFDTYGQPRFASDADGYPIPSPQTLHADFIGVSDETGTIYSGPDTLNLTGEVAPPLPPPPPTLAIADGSVVEGNPRGKSKSGRTEFGLTVVLSSVSAQTVTVNYRTVDGTALAGSDYDSAAGTLTFLPGERFKTIAVSVTSDRVHEAAETFTVEIFGAAGASITDGVATATILNDD